MNSILDRHTARTTHLAEAHLADLPFDNHLSDEQMDDHLIGDLAPEPALHLASCSLCSERLAAAALPIANFESVTLAWSERRSATLPLPDLSTQRPVWQRQMAWVTASFALAIGIAFSNVSRDIRTAAMQPPPRTSVQASAPLLAVAETVPAMAPAPAQISADNQMLKAISDELDSSADTPARLGLDSGSAEPARSLAAISIQD